MCCWIDAGEALEEHGRYSQRGLGVARCNWKETSEIVRQILK